MRIALIAEPDWLKHEATLFRHLVFGLTDEQVRITPVMPVGAMRDELELISDRVDYRPTAWTLPMHLRMRRLLGRLREQETDLIHVMDSGMLGPAAAMARLLQIPLVCSCWSHQAAQTAAGSRGLARRATFVVPVEPMLEYFGDAGSAVLNTVCIPPGVMRIDEPRLPLDQPDQRLSCVVICDGSSNPAMTDFFEGLRRVSETLPQVQLFLYATRQQPHQLWEQVASMGLLRFLNLVGAEPSTQRLLMQCDAVFRPQPSGQVRTILHQAMGAGRPVISVPDPAQGRLIDSDHVHLVDNPSAEAWAEQLRTLARRADALRALGSAGREHVKNNHGVGAYVDRLLEVYHDATGEPLAHIGGE